LVRIRTRPMPAARDRALSAMEVEVVLGLDVPLREQVLWKWLYESAARTQELLLLDVPGLDPAHRLGKDSPQLRRGYSGHRSGGKDGLTVVTAVATGTEQPGH
jgi:hypothetical protein